MNKPLAALLVGLMLPVGGKAIGQSVLPWCSNELPQLQWNNCQGTATFADRNEYVGEFKDGKPYGHGTYTFPDGSKYVGEFKDDKRNGQGTFFYANGGKYVGEFKDDKPNGQGTDTFANGDRYVGEFKDGKRNGHGTISYANGDKYVGEFKDDKRNGQGTYTFASGDKYVGEFKNEMQNGQGSYTFANGSNMNSGMWVDGKFVGTNIDQESISMEKKGGAYVVPVRLNDTITLNAIIYSGAADVSVPADIVSTLMRTKTLSSQDFLGQKTYILTDGSKVPSHRFRIRSLKVGGKVIENVVASIASVKADILLGQSFLNRFKSWSIDNERHVLILK